MMDELRQFISDELDRRGYKPIAEARTKAQ
jgi:hypothetical protein